jgi:CheY-like chemotaxis protein
MEEKLILLVDDDELVIKLLDIMLRPKGYLVDSNLGGVGAYEKAKELQPSCIILDIMMPKIDGWKVLQGLKKDPETRGIPIIVLSVKSAPEDVERLMEMGADRHIAKPFEAVDLVRAIEELTAAPV